MYGPRETSFNPPASPALCDLATLKAMLGIVGAAQDAALTLLLTAAASALEAYCGRPLGERVVTERRHAYDAAESVVLTYAPANTLSSVSHQDEAQTLGEYRLAERYGTVRKVDRSAFAAGEWVFVYKTGYAAGSVPGDLANAAALYAKHLYNTTLAGAVTESIAKESTPDAGSIEYRSAAERTLSRNGMALPADIALSIAHYVLEF